MYFKEGKSLLTPIHFRVPYLIYDPLVAKYLAEMGIPELFEKLLAQFISYLAFNPYGVSLFTPMHFRVPSLIFGPLVAKYLAENGVSGIKKKKKLLVPLISYLAFTLRGIFG